MVAIARGTMDATAALMAAIAEHERRTRLRGHLRLWGQLQAEGYAPPGIDYDRTPVLASKPGSRPPLPEWYIALCSAISFLPQHDQDALTRVFVRGETAYPCGRAFNALLPMLADD